MPETIKKTGEIVLEAGVVLDDAGNILRPHMNIKLGGEFEALIGTAQGMRIIQKVLLDVAQMTGDAILEAGSAEKQPHVSIVHASVLAGLKMAGGNRMN